MMFRIPQSPFRLPPPLDQTTPKLCPHLASPRVLPRTLPLDVRTRLPPAASGSATRLLAARLRYVIPLGDAENTGLPESVRTAGGMDALFSRKDLRALGNRAILDAE